VIDGGIRLDVGVAEHALDVTCVNFDDEVADANDVEVRGMECMEEAVKFELGL